MCCTDRCSSSPTSWRSWVGSDNINGGVSWNSDCVGSVGLDAHIEVGDS